MRVEPHDNDTLLHHLHRQRRPGKIFGINDAPYPTINEWSDEFNRQHIRLDVIDSCLLISVVLFLTEQNVLPVQHYEFAE
jgi:hypothetical protein